MKKFRLNEGKESDFIDYFIEKERNFLSNINIEACKNKDFRFYMSWFVYSIDEYMKKQYDIEKDFSDNFINNKNLNIIFLTFIMNENFRKRVIEDIIEYKYKYNKESIYA